MSERIRERVCENERWSPRSTSAIWYWSLGCVVVLMRPTFCKRPQAFGFPGWLTHDVQNIASPCQRQLIALPRKIFTFVNQKNRSERSGAAKRDGNDIPIDKVPKRQKRKERKRVPRKNFALQFSQRHRWVSNSGQQGTPFLSFRSPSSGLKIV